jgi:hypothetical protein
MAMIGVWNVTTVGLCLEESEQIAVDPDRDHEKESHARRIQQEIKFVELMRVWMGGRTRV